MKLLSPVGFFVTLWTIVCLAPPSMGFPRQEYWRGLPFPSPGDLTEPGIEPRSPALQADFLLSEPPGESLEQSEEAFNSSYQIKYLFIPCHRLEHITDMSHTFIIALKKKNDTLKVHISLKI